MGRKSLGVGKKKNAAGCRKRRQSSKTPYTLALDRNGIRCMSVVMFPDRNSNFLYVDPCLNLCERKIDDVNSDILK